MNSNESLNIYRMSIFYVFQSDLEAFEEKYLKNLELSCESGSVHITFIWTEERFRDCGLNTNDVDNSIQVA